jgi:hypothetical protein
LNGSLGVPFFSFKRLLLSAAARKRRSRSAAAFDSGLLFLPLFFKGKDSAYLSRLSFSFKRLLFSAAGDSFLCFTAGEPLGIGPPPLCNFTGDVFWAGRIFIFLISFS